MQELVILLAICFSSTCFGASLHPSSGGHTMHTVCHPTLQHHNS